MHRNIRLLAWFNFLEDFRPYAPVAVLYFSQVAGSFTLGMSIFAITMLAGALLEVPTGLYSDRAGRRQTLIAGAAASLGALLGYALAGGWGFGWLVIGAILEGLSRALFSGNNDALLYDTLAESGQTADYPAVSGRVSSMFQFALATSAIVGSLAGLISLQLVMWLSVIPQLLNLILSLRFSEPRVHERHSDLSSWQHLQVAFRNIMQNPPLRTLSLASIISFAAGESAFQFRPAFIALLWPVWAINLARLLANLVAAFSFYFSGRLIRRFGEFWLLVGGVSLSTLMNIIGVIFAGVGSPVLMSLNSIFFGVNNVARGGLMQRHFSDAQRATMGSINAFAGSLAMAAFSLLLGWLADHLGIIPALLIAECVGFVPVILYWLTFRMMAAGD